MALRGDQGRGLASALVAGAFLSKGKAFHNSERNPSLAEGNSTSVLTSLWPGFHWLPMFYCTVTPQTRMQTKVWGEGTPQTCYFRKMGSHCSKKPVCYVSIICLSLANWASGTSSHPHGPTDGSVWYVSLSSSWAREHALVLRQVSEKIASSLLFWEIFASFGNTRNVKKIL